MSNKKLRDTNEEPEQAYARAIHEKQTRILQAAAKEMDAVLKRHGVRLTATPRILPDGRIVAQPGLEMAPPQE